MAALSHVQIAKLYTYLPTLRPPVGYVSNNPDVMGVHIRAARIVASPQSTSISRGSLPYYLTLGWSRPHRLIVIGMIRNRYTKEVRTYLGSGSEVPLLVVIPVDPVDLILEFPAVNTRIQYLLDLPFLLIVDFTRGRFLCLSRQWVLLGLMFRRVTPLGQRLTFLASKCTVFASVIRARVPCKL